MLVPPSLLVKDGVWSRKGLKPLLRPVAQSQGHAPPSPTPRRSRPCRQSRRSARGFKLHGVLAVDAGLDVPKEEARKTCAAIRPRLTSAMRDAILNYASLSYVVGEKPDVDILSARLQKAVDGVLGKGLARVALASVIVFDK